MYRKATLDEAHAAYQTYSNAKDLVVFAAQDLARIGLTHKDSAAWFKDLCQAVAREKIERECFETIITSGVPREHS